MANISGRLDNTSLPIPSSSDNISSPVELANLPTLRKKSPFYQGLVWGFTLSLTALVSATIGASIAILSPLSLKMGSIFQKAEFSETAGILPLEDQGVKALLNSELSRPVNILILGVDRVLDAQEGTIESFKGRSDTLLLVRFDPTDKTVRMLSIPRDSRVEIPGVGYSKINDANVEGGPSLTAEVVSNTLNGIKIDRYIRVTTDTFVELVDLVGGLEVYVPEAMQYQDLTQKLDINLEPGWQTLNGKQAEQFARYRNKETGDVGRVQRQQVLLKALYSRLFSPTFLSKLPQAMNILQQHLDTNLTVEEMITLVNFGRTLKSEDLKMVLLPGRFNDLSEYDGRSYWILNSEEIEPIMQNYFGLESSSEEIVTTSETLKNLRIAIQNATDNPGLANRTAEYLTKQGFTQVYVIADSPQKLPTTEIIAQKGDLEGADSLQNLLGIGKVEASSTGHLRSDLTLRLGDDAAQILTDESFLKTNN